MDTYVIHSMVRRVQTRTKRAMSPKRHRFVQRLGGGLVTLRRGRSVTVGQKMFDTLLPELKRLWKEGILEVRARGGAFIDLDTMKVAAPATAKPMPAPPADTAADDKNQGSPKPVYQEGKGVAEDVDPPALAGEGIPEGTAPEAQAPEAEPSGSGRKKKTSKKRGTRK